MPSAAVQRREIPHLRLSVTLSLLGYRPYDPDGRLRDAHALARECRLQSLRMQEEGIDESGAEIAADCAAFLDQLAARFRSAAGRLAPRKTREAA